MHKTAMIFIVLMILTVCYIAGAEDEEKYILCNPRIDNHVAVRKSPRRGAEETGRLECGDKIWTDGKTRNGYLHIYGITEDGEGWVHKGYVVDDRPVIEKYIATVAASGRVAARRYIGGKRNKWLEVCTDVKVYAKSDEWAVTNEGYIQIKYLECWVKE